MVPLVRHRPCPGLSSCGRSLRHYRHPQPDEACANRDGTCAMLHLQPLARAIDFEAGAVDHNMDRSVRWNRKIGVAYWAIAMSALDGSTSCDRGRRDPDPSIAAPIQASLPSDAGAGRPPGSASRRFRSPDRNSEAGRHASFGVVRSTWRSPPASATRSSCRVAEVPPHTPASSSP
jgi:hypothetical protein